MIRLVLLSCLLGVSAAVCGRGSAESTDEDLTKLAEFETLRLQEAIALRAAMEGFLEQTERRVAAAQANYTNNTAIPEGDAEQLEIAMTVQNLTDAAATANFGMRQSMCVNNPLTRVLDEPCNQTFNTACSEEAAQQSIICDKGGRSACSCHHIAAPNMVFAADGAVKTNDTFTSDGRNFTIGAPARRKRDHLGQEFAPNIGEFCHFLCPFQESACEDNIYFDYYIDYTHSKDINEYDFSGGCCLVENYQTFNRGNCCPDPSFPTLDPPEGDNGRCSLVNRYLERKRSDPSIILRMNDWLVCFPDVDFVNNVVITCNSAQLLYLIELQFVRIFYPDFFTPTIVAAAPLPPDFEFPESMLYEDRGDIVNDGFIGDFD